MRLRLIWWEGSESLRMNQNSSLQSLIETFSKQIKYYDSNLKFWSRIRSSPWIKWSLISKQSFSFSSLDGPHRPWLDRWVVGRWLFWFKVLSNSLLSEWLPGIGEKLTLFPVSFFYLKMLKLWGSLSRPIDKKMPYTHSRIWKRRASFVWKRKFVKKEGSRIQYNYPCCF